MATTRTTRVAPVKGRPATREPEPEGDEDLFDEAGGAAEIDEDEDLFDDADIEAELDGARSGYVTLDDLNGRLLVIKPSVLGTRPSKERNQDDYEFVECEAVIVLDGEDHELMPVFPAILEDFQFWGTNVVNTLKPKIRNGRGVVGRLGQRKAQRYSTLAWVLNEPDEDEYDQAKAALKEYKIAQAQAQRARRR